jgi:hypothetical protein
MSGPGCVNPARCDVAARLSLRERRRNHATPMAPANRQRLVRPLLCVSNMTSTRAKLSWFSAVLLASSLAFASPTASSSTVRVGPASVPASADAKLRVAVRDVVKRELAQAKFDPALRTYTISPALVQLRRYVEPGANTVALVCVLDLAVVNDTGAVLGSVRGRAKAIPANDRDALQAAARSAIAELPGMLAAIEAERARRVATR